MSKDVQPIEQPVEHPTMETSDFQTTINPGAHYVGDSDAKRNSTKFSGLKVDLSYYCPLECDHCLFDAGPSRPMHGMSDAEVRNVIESASELGTFYSISIGHQEPFVQFGRLCKILGWLKSNFDGYGIALNTTAIWAKSRESVIERLATLTDLELDTLMISVDGFHQSQVPLEKCIMCAAVAQEMGIKVVVQCVYSGTSHRLEYFRAQMEPYLDADRIKWIESPFCPCGRARKAIPRAAWPQLSYEDGSCNVMEIVYVAPDGNVTPCCGGGLVAQGLVVGNLHEWSMARIVSEVEQDPIVNCLAIHKGPAGLVKTLQEEHPTWQPRQQYTGTCHTCFEIMNDPSLVESLRDSYENRKAELLLARLYMEANEGLFAPP